MSPAEPRHGLGNGFWIARFPRRFQQRVGPLPERQRPLNGPVRRLLKQAFAFAAQRCIRMARQFENDNLRRSRIAGKPVHERSIPGGINCHRAPAPSLRPAQPRRTSPCHFLVLQDPTPAASEALGMRTSGPRVARSRPRYCRPLGCIQGLPCRCRT